MREEWLYIELVAVVVLVWSIAALKAVANPWSVESEPFVRFKAFCICLSVTSSFLIFAKIDVSAS